jgi:hypothetical protein
LKVHHDQAHFTCSRRLSGYQGPFEDFGTEAMDFDDDAPPDLVEATDSMGEVGHEDTPKVKVPITIVTGNDFIYEGEMRVKAELIY